MSGRCCMATISTTAYFPSLTGSLVDELLLDFSMDVEELPTDVEAALEAEEVLSAQQVAVAAQSVTAAVKESKYGVSGIRMCFPKMRRSP